MVLSAKTQRQEAWETIEKNDKKRLEVLQGALVHHVITGSGELLDKLQDSGMNISAGCGMCTSLVLSELEHRSRPYPYIGTAEGSDVLFVSPGSGYCLVTKELHEDLDESEYTSWLSRQEIDI